MARSLVRNSATSGSNHLPIVRSIIASDDRLYEQSWCRMTDRTIRLASVDRSYDPSSCRDQSRRPETDRMISGGILRPIARSVGASGDRSYDQSLRRATDRTSNRSICDRSYDWSCNQSQSRGQMGTGRE